MTADFDRRKADILDRVDLLRLADELGLQPVGKKDRFCPEHNDQPGPGHRPNLHLYADKKEVHCFACGWHADPFALVAKVKGCDFKGAFAFLATHYGLPPAGASRPPRRRPPAPVVPHAAPLPPTPSPTLTATPPPAATRPPLPRALWRTGLAADAALALLDAYRADFAAVMVSQGEAFAVTAKDADPGPQQGGHSPRVEVFAALLGLTPPASLTAAGAWLHQAKGITPATQDRFRLAFLADPQAVAGALVQQFGLDLLLELGLYGQAKDGQPYFAFKTHRLLFPFFWQGAPVDVQGRDVAATDKNRRFRNTGGRNPIPYNAAALGEARTAGAPVFLCEGATDTLTLAQAGRHAVGIVGTGGFKAAWLPAFADLTVYLAFDADEAGQRAAVAVSQVFVAGGLPAPKVVKLPPGTKDITDFFRSHAT